MICIEKVDCAGRSGTFEEFDGSRCPEQALRLQSDMTILSRWSKTKS
jgi:hypothetical protein